MHAMILELNQICCMFSDIVLANVQGTWHENLSVNVKNDLPDDGLNGRNMS
jgi:hypothetical protein